MKTVGHLHVITDSHSSDPEDHATLARLALAGGADVIQLRDKSMTDGELILVGKQLRTLCRERGASLVINDRVVVARALGAGVHLGKDDASAAEAREALGSDALIGMTAGSPEEAATVSRLGADYIGFGHIYPTGSKVKTSPPVGLDGLRAAVALTSLPVVAIGGITAANAPDVMAAGAWGVAVIAAIRDAKHPDAATREIAAIVNRFVQET